MPESSVTFMNSSDIRGCDVTRSVPGAVATGSHHGLPVPVTALHPVASTTPRGLPARGPRSAPGTDCIPSRSLSFKVGFSLIHVRVQSFFRIFRLEQLLLKLAL